MNFPGYFSARIALRSVVLKPSLYHSFRYVGWKMATSTWPASKTSVIRSCSEYFWYFSIGHRVFSGPSPW